MQKFMPAIAPKECTLDCMLAPIDSTIWLWELVLKGTLLAATQRMLRR